MTGSATADELNPEPRQLAKRARLRYVMDDVPGFTRRRRGKGFSYLDDAGDPLRDTEHLARIEALVLPPAWTDVWICPRPDGHIQATGRDEKGRKQYRYHDRWQRTTNWIKFERLRAFGAELPAIRRRVRNDLRSADDRTRVLALAVLLLDRTAIRIGNREYAEENDTHGLTTLTKSDVRVRGGDIRFEFTGKSGKPRLVELADRPLAKRLKELLGRPGERLLQAYVDAAGETDRRLVTVESEHVNEYLHAIAPPGCTAKTFRTWHGTVAAFEVLAAACQTCHAGNGSVRAAATTVAKAIAGKTNGRAAGRANAVRNGAASTAEKLLKKTLKESITAASAKLGNTPAVCRSYYVHPGLCDLFAGERLATMLGRLRPRPTPGLSPTELRLLALLTKIERMRH